MTRKILSGVLAIAGIAAIGFVPTSCQSGGIGDPCTPEDEYTASFSGFKVTEDNIESRSFQCQSRICLVNHFQGRVTCPLGQPPPQGCGNPGDPPCPSGSDCKLAATFAPFCAIKCTVDADCNAGATCKGGKCSDDGGCPAGFTCQDTGHYCSCDQNSKCPPNFSCTNQDGSPLSGVGQCTEKVCHQANNCQVPDNGGMAVASNQGKECCVPGTDTPIATAVCGQCAAPRNADNTVYCSCKCGEPLDASGHELPRNANFNYCDCPDGFECKEVRKNIGISDPLLAGQYCIKTKTEFSTSMPCGSVKGHVGAGTGGDVACAGTPSL